MSAWLRRQLEGAGEVISFRIRRRLRPLRELYSELNHKFWDGRLPPALRELTFGGPVETRGVMVRRVGVRDGMKGLRGAGRSGCIGVFIPPGEFRPAKIRVLGRWVEERRVLLHEMCHAATWTEVETAGAHGPLWRAEMRRLASLGEAWAAEEAGRYEGLGKEGRVMGEVVSIFPQGAEEAEFVRLVLDMSRFTGKRPPCWCGQKGAARLSAAGVPLDAIRQFSMCPKHGRRATTDRRRA